MSLLALLIFIWQTCGSGIIFGFYTYEYILLESYPDLESACTLAFTIALISFSSGGFILGLLFPMFKYHHNILFCSTLTTLGLIGLIFTLHTGNTVPMLISSPLIGIGGGGAFLAALALNTIAQPTLTAASGGFALSNTALQASRGGVAGLIALTLAGAVSGAAVVWSTRGHVSDCVANRSGETRDPIRQRRFKALPPPLPSVTMATLAIGQSSFLASLVDRPQPAMTLVSIGQAAAGLLALVTLSANGLLVLGSVMLVPWIVYLAAGTTVAMWAGCLLLGPGGAAVIGGAFGLCHDSRQGGFMYLAMACGNAIGALDIDDLFLAFIEAGTIVCALCSRMTRVPPTPSASLMIEPA
eukprot:gnl/Dysnectes_brevis/1836_a2106_1275.p1 GENE.gnl/Dysnectes_brevis/1836_a2106_1275~~gnl/Dysnectes_brevis/1836_a2106_1275.p1  ORF type:complete len:356 (+),score=67.25 gnl/Dysnectes_brevis/1836_a2106_1275:91-1158(+)